MIYKVGTMPMQLVLKYNYQPRIGLYMLVREDTPGSKWFEVVVDDIVKGYIVFCSKV